MASVKLVSTEGTPTVIRDDGTPLPPRFDLFCHSCNDLEWAHGGPSSAQLALALLADCLGDDDCAKAWHHKFKWYVVARLPAGRDWTLDERRQRSLDPWRW